jgi:hypothetical protein
MSVDVSKLTPDEKLKLFRELELEQKAVQEQKKKEREQYKELTQKTVSEAMKKLMNMSSELSKLKADIFNSFITILDMKAELYGVKEGQQSHDFTNEHGETISIGSRIIDGWDDTVESGIAMVNKYIESLATDDKSAKLVNMIYRLLRKDSKGNLKGNRVLELQKLADEINDPTFTEGVTIIRSAYRPVRSAYFIEASYKDELGKRVNVPLSITSVPFPENDKPQSDVL